MAIPGFCNWLTKSDIRNLGFTNLSTWESLETATNVFGEVQFIDGAANTQPARFYKAMPWP